MKRLLFVIVGILSLIGCETGNISKMLAEADTLVVKEEYDSAYQMILSLDESTIVNQEALVHYNLLKVQIGYLLGKPSSLADSLLDEAISYYQNHKNVEKLTDAYYYKAVGFNRKRNFKKSIELYKQAELLTKQSNNRYQQFKVLEGIVFVNAVNSNFHLQLIYAKKALMLSQEVNNKKWEIYSHYWLHLAYSELGYNDSAMSHLNAIPQYLKYVGKKDLPYFLANLALEYKKKDPDIAKQYLQESLSYKELTRTYEHLADICYDDGKPEECLNYLKKALVVNDGYPKDNIIRNLIEFDLERGKTDSISDMVTQIFEIRDSIDAKLKDDTIKDLQTRFDHELALKEKDRVFVRGILIMTIVIFVLIGAFSTVYFRRRHLAKLQMLDYQMQINDNLRQIEILRTSGTDTKQEVERLNKLIEDIMKNKAPKLDRGRMLYDDIINGNITMIDWNREHEQMFLDYYTATHYDIVKKMKNVRRVEELTPHKLFYLILVKLGKTDEQIQRMMSVSDSTLRGLKHRTKPL